MARLSEVQDTRWRQGTRYRLPGLLGVLRLATVHAERSLRGMWPWASARWDRIAEVFDLWAPKGPPSYRGLWNLIAAIDAEGLGRALCSQGDEEERVSVDGKALRGSKRATEPALQVVTAAGNRYRQVLGQLDVEGKDAVETTIALLREMQLEGKLVSLDAGLLQRGVVEAVVRKRLNGIKA